MNDLSLNNLLLAFQDTEQEGVFLEASKAVQVACNVLQVTLAVLQRDGAGSQISIGFPKEWLHMQEMADEYTQRLGLPQRSLPYKGITANAYSTPALLYAYRRSSRTLH